MRPSLIHALMLSVALAGAGQATAEPDDRPCAAAPGGGSVPPLCKAGDFDRCSVCGTRQCVDGRWTECVVDASGPCPAVKVIFPDGPEVTPTDIEHFDARWAGTLADAPGKTRAQICGRCDFCSWELSEVMHALVRMHDLTGQERYVDRLRELVDGALQFRDDHHPGGVCEPGGPSLPPTPLDDVRGRNMPAWGGRSPSIGGMHSVSVAVSNQYAYAMAAFARIVLENPALRSRLGAEAVRHANAVIETVWAFMPEMKTRDADGAKEAYLVSRLPGYKTPNFLQCWLAYEAEVERIKREEKDQTKWPGAIKRAESMRSSCEKVLKIGPMAHNINLAFGMVLIELGRVLDNPFYRSAPDRSSDAERTREMIPLLVSRLHRYFARRLWHKDTPDGVRYCWHFSDDLPSDVNYNAEDTSHGSWDIRFLELVTRDLDRLNAVAAPAGERIALDAEDLRRFSRTFLQKVFRTKHLGHDVTGKPTSPIDQYDSACQGWVTLASADPRVHTACRNIALQYVGTEQPYLTIGSHAALLAHKRFAPAGSPAPAPTTVPDVVGMLKADAVRFVRAAGLVPKYMTPGTWVSGQRPAAGLPAPRGSTVELTFKKGSQN